MAAWLRPDGGLRRMVGLVACGAIAVAGCARAPAGEQGGKGTPPGAASSAAGEPADEPQPGTLEGTSTVVGMAPPAVRGAPSVVMLVAASPADELPAGGAPVTGLEPVVLDQVGVSFVPTVLLARPGQPVEFRNSEDVLHNVHVARRDSGETVFNIATVAFGSFLHDFSEPGAYFVTCDIHAAMYAYIVVVATPYAVVARPDGAFVIEDVPYGAYELTVWSVTEDRPAGRRVAIDGPRTALTFD